MLYELDSDTLAVILFFLAEEAPLSAARILATCRAIRALGQQHKECMYEVLARNLMCKTRRLKEREIVSRMDPMAQDWLDPTRWCARRIRRPVLTAEILYWMHLEWWRPQKK